MLAYCVWFRKHALHVSEMFGFSHTPVHYCTFAKKKNGVCLPTGCIGASAAWVRAEPGLPLSHCTVCTVHPCNCNGLDLIQWVLLAVSAVSLDSPQSVSPCAPMQPNAQPMAVCAHILPCDCRDQPFYKGNPCPMHPDNHPLKLPAVLPCLGTSLSPHTM